MKIAPVSLNENERVAALLNYDVLDTDFESAYDEITELASTLCGTPISLISFIDPDRQWFKSKIGLEPRETSRDLAFCAHAILQNDVFVVEDTLLDERFADNPLVFEDSNIRFYAGAPLITPGGHALGTLCVIDRIPRKFDIAHRRTLQILAKQVMTHLELRLAFRRLQSHTDKLLATNAAKDRFFYIIAHDLRGPFNVMTGYAKILVDRLDRPELQDSKEMAEEIAESCTMTLKLLDNLLEWALCESGNIKFQPSAIDLEELSFEVTDLLAGLAVAKSIRLIRECPEEIMVHADRYMLFSALQNLLHNAIKFTPNGGTVRVEITSTGPTATLTVTDTGVGMTEQALQAFILLGETTNTTGTAGEGGTGLGLLLCKQFVEKNGSRLEISSKVGEGSTFRFELPLAETQQP